MRFKYQTQKILKLLVNWLENKDVTWSKLLIIASNMVLLLFWTRKSNYDCGEKGPVLRKVPMRLKVMNLFIYALVQAIKKNTLMLAPKLKNSCKTFIVSMRSIPLKRNPKQLILRSGKLKTCRAEKLQKHFLQIHIPMVLLELL